MVIDLHQHSKTSDFVVRESYDAAGHLEVDQRFATGFQPTSRTVTGKSYTFQSKKWAAAAAPVTGVSLFPLNGPDAHTLGAAAKLIGTDQINGQPTKHFRTVGLPGATMISADVWVDASGHLVQFKATASATATTIVTFSWGRTVPAISVPPLG
jgi:hypothetical protein